MSFCNYSQDMINSSYTTVDNVFIAEYLPEAPARYVDIYLFGLFLCSRHSQGDNSLDTMARVLNLDKEDILTAFTYWDELGLVHLLQKMPVEIVYLPVRTDAAILKKVKPQKYKQFNKGIESVLCGRMISPNEFNEYYIFLETTFFEPKALIAVAKHCVKMKGDDINYPYILKVARNLSVSGIKTFEEVDKKLASNAKYTDDLNLLFKALAIKRFIDFEDRRLFEKWTEGMNFSADTVFYVAKASKHSTMQRLDAKLESYFKLGLFSEKEIEDYEKNRDTLFGLAKEVNKILGVYYQSVDYIIEGYVSPWLQKGFDEEALKLIAKHCFRTNKRTIDSMNDMIDKFYRLGLVSADAIDQYTESMVSQDEKIKKVLDSAGLVRNVSSADRTNFKNWTSVWNFDEDVIVYAASLSVNATNPLSYMNKILSDFKVRGIDTVEKAKAQAGRQVENKVERDYKTREYTKGQLDALFDNLDDIVI